MSIFSNQEIQINGKTIRRLTRSNNFWACGYGDDKVIVAMTRYDSSRPNNGALIAGQTVDGPISLNGFGADTFQELQSEIERLELIDPLAVE